MKDIHPPSNQANKASVALAVFAATKAGVSKIPAPITIPTINAPASIADSVGWGAVPFVVII